MDLITGIINAVSPGNLLFCFIGCVLGTLAGVLPGLGPAASLSILLPLTMYTDPTKSIVMLAGLFYGVMYGGSTTSILVNIPGEAASVPTCLDGFPMTKQGRAGQALWISAVGSFIAGTMGCIALSFLGPGLALYALKFGPAEYSGLLFFSLTALVSFSGTSIIKGLAAGIFGILIATVGADPVTGTMRFNYGSTALMRGLDLVPLAVGLFGIGEILSSAEEGVAKIFEGKLGSMMPRGTELRKGIVASLRGTAVGFVTGLLPGMIPTLASFIAYDVEKRFSKYPEKFGSGLIEGVAAPESANNACAQAGFIPLMALGIPTGPALAIILAALMMYGLQPGPTLFQVHKEFAWTVIGSMYIGNVMLLIINLPLVGLWARISLIPYKFMGPTILGICVIGAYSTRNTMFDVWVALGAGVLGYIMKKRQWPMAPLIMGLILGPMLEKSIRQSLTIGGPLIFFQRPISVGFIIAAVVLLVVMVRALRRIPKEILAEGNSEK